MGGDGSADRAADGRPHVEASEGVGRPRGGVADGSGTRSGVTPTAPDVWLDAQGAQNRAHFDRGIPRFINEQLRHVVQQAPDQVRAVALNPALPLTGNLNWLLGSGRVRWDGGVGPHPAPL